MSSTSALTGSAETVGSAGRWLTHQRVTGGTLPAFLALTVSVHTFAVPAAVFWLASPFMNAQDGRHSAATAPSVICFAGTMSRGVQGRERSCLVSIFDL